MTRRVGTLLWQAPELLRNESHYSFPVDVYSYAVILWELLTRRVPYEGQCASVWDLEEFILAGGRPSLASCPPSLATLIDQSWAEDPALRPTFAQLMVRLRTGVSFE